MKKISLTLFFICAAHVLLSASTLSPSSFRIISGGAGCDAKHVDGKIVISNTTPKSKYTTCRLSSPAEGWNIENIERLDMSVKNTSEQPLKITLYVVEENSFGSVANTKSVEEGSLSALSCNLRDLHPDGTPKFDPNRVGYLEVVIEKLGVDEKVEIVDISTSGTTSRFIPKPQTLAVPPMLCDREPSAGCRVKYQIDPSSDIYGVLYLPEGWSADRRYPMIVEFPGNIFFTNRCYSTGAPEQCVIGYGMSKGVDAVWLSLPFVNYSKGEIALSGWGKIDDTVDHTIKIVKEICEKYSVDSHRVVLTGFSRGAIACGFIGLHNREIAALWCGLHMCQHWDGDGWGGSKYEDAKVRALNGSKIPQFHTDNNSDALRVLLREAKINVEYAESGLKSHSTAMFLDDRESTQRVRKWFRKLIDQ